MSGAQSISTRRAYGVQRVCRVWHCARSSVYARRQATPSSMFHSGPFTLAHDRESRAVHEEMQAGTCGGATQRKIEMLATP